MTKALPSAEQLERQALEAFRARRQDEAAAAFEAARKAYTEAGERGKAAEMANNLSVALLFGGHARRALQAVEGMPQVFHELGDATHEAQAWGNLASALEACGELRAAEDSYRHALELFVSLGDDENRALCLRSLSQLQLRRGRVMEASLTAHSALQAQGGRPRGLTRLLGWLLRLRAR
ncbi:MAG: tetratricopeptide repeat protein [Chloroflexota bacterium]